MSTDARRTLLPEGAYTQLPDSIKLILKAARTNEERDILLITAIAAFSGVIDCHGVYDDKTIHPNLFVVVLADPASRKGIIKYVPFLIEEYDKEIQAKASERKGSFIIPANISAAALYQRLQATKGKGVIVETEMSTMTNALKQDWGGWITVLLKAFGQEKTFLSRKGELTDIVVEEPKLAIVLSGTPDDLEPLINSSESGLFSRIIFYSISPNFKWKNVAPTPNSISLDKYFRELQSHFTKFLHFTNSQPFELVLSPAKWRHLDHEFAKLTDHYVGIDKSLKASAFRMGVITFKIAMVLTAFRRFDWNSAADKFECDSSDFVAAMTLGFGFISKAEEILATLPKKAKRTLPEHILRFFDRLPDQFKREELTEAHRGDISVTTADRYLKALLGDWLEKDKAGYYRKLRK